MDESSVVSQVVERLNHLPHELQRRVLEFVETLAHSSSGGVPGSQLMLFAGAISLEDLEAMRSAIEEGCEQVDLDEW